jgi:hypothetical protein
MDRIKGKEILWEGKEYFEYHDDEKTKEPPEDVWESGVEKGH